MDLEKDSDDLKHQEAEMEQQINIKHLTFNQRKNEAESEPDFASSNTPPPIALNLCSVTFHTDWEDP